MGRLFGTDGVRGRAGSFPLDEPMVTRLGAATRGGLLTRAPRPLTVAGARRRRSVGAGGTNASVVVVGDLEEARFD